ncbi:GTPase domain-containing protein [Sphingomonas sp. SKA58]|uniref:GTPase domain-containing protein n=1 Tax=Sphingomonas sp. (strain SKA58) TaxID=314266 RepID=UPI0012EA4102|nr:Rab family GTPase [Sphingomonas sp. SKA58]
MLSNFVNTLEQQGGAFLQWVLGVFRGKKLAVLGPRASGKTTLISFLLNGELPQEYFATAKPEKFEGKKISLGSLELRVHAVTDLPGDVQSHSDWERQYKDSNIACYMIDASKVYARDETYIRMIRSEARHIGEWLDSRKRRPPAFFLVATHCDLIPDYASLPEGQVTVFTDSFWKDADVQKIINLAGGSKYVKCVAGSLKDISRSERLIGEILYQVIA